mmetsp:Transcript_6102/g.11807  ORF Transcript_6102/g.11807 Transcript_6102/m.11807 type:complete len:289 (-) Transcript_6102:675-1541(-)
MVTQHRHLVVSVVVKLELGGVALHKLLLAGVVLKLVQLLIQSVRRVERAEHLGGEARHELLEVDVEGGGCELVEYVVLRLLGFARVVFANETLHVLVYLLEVGFLPLPHKRVLWVVLKLLGPLLILGDKLERVLVLDRVLSQEVEHDGRALLVLPQGNVLHAQRAAADRVSLLGGVLLVAGTDGEEVDEPQGCVLLHDERGVGFEALCDFCADVAHHLGELARLLELLAVRLALERRPRREEDVLELPVDCVPVEGQPRGLVLVAHRLPRVPGEGAAGGARLGRAVHA